MKRITTYLILNLLIFCFVHIGYTNTDDFYKKSIDEIQKQIKNLKPLEIKIKQNLKNPKKPILYWKPKSEAVSYRLYFNNELIYSGDSNIFYPQRDLNYGKYSAQVHAIKQDKSSIIGSKYQIYIGLEPPVIITPKNKVLKYSLRPQFKWKKTEGADEYALYLNGKKIYEGNMTSFTPDFNLELGENNWGLVAKNKFQKVKTKKFKFALIPIKQVKLLNPNPNQKIYLISTDDLPLFKWENQAGKNTIFELYIDHQLVYKGKNTEFTVPKEKLAEFRKPGDHTWYVLTEKDYQRVNSVIRYYNCVENIGLEIGLIAGPNISKPSMPSDNASRGSYGSLGGGGGIYADYTIPFINSFELHVVLEIFYDYRRYRLPYTDWTVVEQSGGNDQDMQFVIIKQHWLYLPLMVKPTYRKDNIVLYGLFGFCTDIHLGGDFERNPHNYYNYDNLKPNNSMGFSIPVSFGIFYDSDVKMWGNTNMGFGVELRYYQSVSKELRNFSNRDSNYGHMSNMELMILITSRLLEL